MSTALCCGRGLCSGMLVGMKRHHLTDFLLFLAIAIIGIVGGGRLIHYMWTGQSNAEFISSIRNPCKELPIVTGSRMVIIRIDDIQSYSLEDVSIRMIDDAEARGVPLSLGVIPKSMDSQTPIYRHVRQNRCWLEIALHGWDHEGVNPETPEFAGLDKETAAIYIAEGKRALEKISGEKITTFIPPLNNMSADAREAVAEAGIPVISSEGARTFDYTTTTYDYGVNRLNKPETVVANCNARVAKTSMCIVMVHPQDFITDGVFDPVKYEAYAGMLDQLKAANYTFVRFKDVADKQ